MRKKLCYLFYLDWYQRWRLSCVLVIGTQFNCEPDLNNMNIIYEF